MHTHMPHAHAHTTSASTCSWRHPCSFTCPYPYPCPCACPYAHVQAHITSGIRPILVPDTRHSRRALLHCLIRDYSSHTASYLPLTDYLMRIACVGPTSGYTYCLLLDGTTHLPRATVATCDLRPTWYASRAFDRATGYAYYLLLDGDYSLATCYCCYL